MSQIIMKDRNGYRLFPVGLLLVRSDRLDVKAGAVYPYEIDSAGVMKIIDGANDLTTVAAGEYVVFDDKATYHQLRFDFRKAGFSEGDVVMSCESLPRKHINHGYRWCLNNKGDWVAMNNKNLRLFKPHYSAAALTYRLMAAQAEARPGGIVEMLTPTALSVGYSIDFKPAELEKHVVVKVEFTPGGKLYPYRLKDGMIAEAGDDAVVVVNNPDYPELKGTKVVRIKEVTTIDAIPGNYKYVEHVVSNRGYREEAKAKAYAAALKVLEKKSAELEQVKARATRLELEIAKMAEDVAAGKY